MGGLSELLETFGLKRKVRVPESGFHNLKNGINLLEKGDKRKAAEEFATAVEKGYCEGLDQLWSMYPESDDDIKQDITEYFITTTNNGNFGVLPYLWDIFFSDIEDNKPAIAECFTAAAKKGNPEALVYLGHLFLYGEWFEQDFQQAESLFNMAAESGESTAFYYLGMMMIEEVSENGDIQQGVKLLHRAADEGVDLAQVRIGEMYLEGVHLPIDYLKAKYYIQEAAKAGNEEAMALYHANSSKLYSVTEKPNSRKDFSGTQATSSIPEPQLEAEPKKDETEKKSSSSSSHPNVYTPGTKLCATCEYWTGKREINNARTMVYVYPDNKGKSGGRCMHTKWKNINTMREYHFGCKDFYKWNYLK